MNRWVDYNSIADEFDRRYDRSDYGPVLSILLSFVGSRPDVDVLEVGCGTGHWLRELDVKGYSVTGLEPAKKMLLAARQKSADQHLVQGRAEAIPCRQRMFDRIFCINALHHFTDQEEFFAEAEGVARPGAGIMVVGLDPHTGLDRWWIYDVFPQVISIDRNRYPATSRIRAMMAAHGFPRCNTSLALHMPVLLDARSTLETGRLEKATTSQLTLLTDDEYNAGIARLLKDIEAAESRGETLTIGADLRLYATIGWSQ